MVYLSYVILLCFYFDAGIGTFLLTPIPYKISSDSDHSTAQNRSPAPALASFFPSWKFTSHEKLP